MRRSLRQLSAVLLVAGLAAAQPPDVRALRQEVRILLGLRALNLTQEQASAILTAAREVREQATELDRAREQFFVASHDSIITIEWALIRNSTVEPGPQELIERERARYLDLARDGERKVAAGLERIDQVLTPAQQAILEPDEAASQRAAEEAATRRQRAEALRQATADVVLWIPNSPPDDFPTQVGERVDNILRIAYPDAPAEQTAPIRAKLHALYSQARAMSPTQFITFRDSASQRLRDILVPLTVAEQERYVLTRAEWVGLWRGEMGARLLAALVPTLPSGAGR